MKAMVRLPSLAPVRQEMSGEIDGEWSYVEPRPGWGTIAKINERYATLSGCLFTYSVWPWYGNGQQVGDRYALELRCRRIDEGPFFPDYHVRVVLDDEAQIKRIVTKGPMPEGLARIIRRRELVAWVVDDARSEWSR